MTQIICSTILASLVNIIVPCSFHFSFSILFYMEKVKRFICLCRRKTLVPQFDDVNARNLSI